MVKSYLRWLPLLLGTLLLAACNLGQGVPTGDITPTADLFIPAELPTSTPDPNAPPPTIEGFAPAADSVGESLGPVTVTGELVTLELVTIRVKRGDAVTGVNCLVIHQETNSSDLLGTSSTEGPSLDGTFTEVFTYTPEQGGTFSVSCTGNALTVSGLLEVDAQSSPFAVEAKG